MSVNNIVFSTPWFSIVAKEIKNTQSPYYIMDATDCVSIIAMSKDKQVLLVRQYRPTMDIETLELPSGHIEPGETPVQAAHRELLEETGYIAENLELLRVLVPETGRIGFKSWCYFASNVTWVKNPDAKEILALIKCNQDKLLDYIKSGEINNALDIAIIFLSIQNKKLSNLS